MFSLLARRLVALISIVAVLCVSIHGPGEAQARRLSLIRDAEIETLIRRMLSPIASAAGLSSSSLDVYLVRDPALNAFVAGGQNIFINTGLLLRARSAGELLGVLAHETGHIAGGHLARGQEELERAQTIAIISALIGMAAGAASGNAGAATALTLGGGSMAERSFLAFTRGMEASADQAALRYLDRAGLPADGLLSFLDTLADQDVLATSRQAEYVRTHPLTQDRLEAIRTHVARSPLSGQPLPPDLEDAFQRIRAKLGGFLEPNQVARMFPRTDASFAARYARAIAAWRTGRFDEGVAEVAVLAAEEPQNPYLQELLGQMYLEAGRIPEARRYYERAIAALPNEPTILVPLAQAELATGIEADRRSARDRLLRATSQRGGGTPLAWRLLATALGQDGNLGGAAVALAEEALARGDIKTAREQAARALQTLSYGQPGYQRANDILESTRDRD